MENDLDSNGVLDKAEFIACIRQLDFGLTRKEILYMLSQVDTNQDGLVSYEEFVPCAINILIQIVKDKILESETSHEVQKFFHDKMSEFDSQGIGRLSLSELRDCLASV